MKAALRSKNILHRALAAACVLLVLAGVAAMAQRPRRSSRLRALGLLEIAANGRARLVPIAIKVGDQFYEAGVYRADPRPLALDPQTVYEGEQSGESVGLFTVTNAALVKGVWVGAGQWHPNNAPEPPKKAKAAPPTNEEDEGPPVLRKPSAAPPAKPPSAPEEKPVPAAKSAEAAPSAPVTIGSSDDSDRPTLRRGKPEQPVAADVPAEIATKPGAGQRQAGAKAASGAPVRVLTAVSDAGGPEPKPFVMELSADESSRYEQGVRRMADEAIRKFAAARPQHKPGAAGELTDVRMKVFDLHYNNEPDIVFSARLPEAIPVRGGKPAFDYFVTVVATVDMYGQMRQLFSAVTDSAHMDVYPRLELIDAVDAEGTGSAQLLFRQIADRGYSYALYRVGMDKLWKLFESGTQSF